MKEQKLEPEQASVREHTANFFYLFFAVACSLFLITTAVNLEVPLYKVYAQQAGYGNGLTAVVFASYIVGLLPTLIFLGGISEWWGCKRTLLFSVLVAGSATLLMIISPTIMALFVARILQGVGVGLSVGAGTSYLVHCMPDKPKYAAAIVALTTSIGFGSGAFYTSIVLWYQQSLVPISYWSVFIFCILCFVGDLFLPEQPVSGSVSFRLPLFSRETIFIGSTIALAWAVTGIVIALLPSQLAQYNLGKWSGVALFLVNGTGALMQPFARRLQAKTAIQIGNILIPSGYILLVCGAWLGNVFMVLLGAAIAGSACYGFTYIGGLAEVTQKGQLQPARAVSGYFLFAYFGFGIPSVLLGFLADRFSIVPVLACFGCFVIIASLLLTSIYRKMS